MTEQNNNTNFLPLEPGNSGRVKYNVNSNGKFRAAYINESWYSPTGEIVTYLNEDPKIFSGNVFISVVSKVLVKDGLKYFPSVEINTRNCSNLVISPKDIDKIAGLKPIDFNSNKEV